MLHIAGKVTYPFSQTFSFQQHCMDMRSLVVQLHGQRHFALQCRFKAILVGGV
jgi:hypothetical protein